MREISLALRVIAVPALLSGLVISAPAQAQNCWAGELFYSADEYLALQTEVERTRFVRSEIAAMWGEASPRVANFANLYNAGNFSDALARPSADAIEEALALSSAQRSAILQGRSFNAGRVDRVLQSMREGGNYASRLGNALSTAGELVDAVNIFYHAANAVETGDRGAKVAALQAAFSLGRSRLARRWGGSIGPMMAMTGLLEYSINTFGQTAWDRHEAYWWEGYRNFTTRYWHMNADDWLEVYKTEGHEGIDRRLREFWDHGTEGVSGLAASNQDDSDSGPEQGVAGSAYAIAEYPDSFAARYMVEVVEPMIHQAIADRADQALNEAIDAFNRDCDAALEEAIAIDLAYTLIEENRNRFEVAACPIPQSFERGISGEVTEDDANRQVRELRDRLNRAAAAEGFDYAAFERAYVDSLDAGLLTDIATEFSLQDLEVRPTPDFRPATVDLLLPPEVLSTVWSGGPNSFGAMLRTAHIAFGKGLADLGSDVLDDHFGGVNLITRYEDARSPLVLHVTGFDFEYRNRAGIRTRWSGTGKIGVSACFEGEYLFQEAFQSEETEPYSRGSDFSNGDALSVVASDVIRQTLDMVSARVVAEPNARLQAYLESENTSAAEPARFEVPEFEIAASATTSDDAALDSFEAALDRAAAAVRETQE